MIKKNVPVVATLCATLVSFSSNDAEARHKRGHTKQGATIATKVRSFHSQLRNCLENDIERVTHAYEDRAVGCEWTTEDSAPICIVKGQEYLYCAGLKGNATTPFLDWCRTGECDHYVVAFIKGNKEYKIYFQGDGGGSLMLAEYSQKRDICTLNMEDDMNSLNPSHWPSFLMYDQGVNGVQQGRRSEDYVAVKNALYGAVGNAHDHPFIPSIISMANAREIEILQLANAACKAEVNRRQGLLDVIKRHAQRKR